MPNSVKQSMNIAIILAGGTGSRLGESLPKQFYDIAGRMVIEHTIDIFEQNSRIDEIAVVMNEAYISLFEEIVQKNSWKKVKKILKGGRERYESTLAAIDAYSEYPDYRLIIHDAVRPMVSQRIIDDVITALDHYNAVNVAVPATDTIIVVDASEKIIQDIPNRNYLKRGQSPQGFKLSTIREAYQKALQDKSFKSSEDCGTVIKYLPDEKIYVVLGEESNMKLTYKEDSYILERLFQLHSKTNL